MPDQRLGGADRAWPSAAGSSVIARPTKQAEHLVSPASRLTATRSAARWLDSDSRKRMHLKLHSSGRLTTATSPAIRQASATSSYYCLPTAISRRSAPRTALPGDFPSAADQPVGARSSSIRRSLCRAPLRDAKIVKGMLGAKATGARCREPAQRRAAPRALLACIPGELSWDAGWPRAAR